MHNTNSTLVYEIGASNEHTDSAPVCIAAPFEKMWIYIYKNGSGKEVWSVTYEEFDGYVDWWVEKEAWFTTNISAEEVQAKLQAFETQIQEVFRELFRT